MADNFGWVYIITLAVMNCLTFASVHWQLIQRFTSVRDERETLRVGLCVTALHLVTPILIFTPAMAARFFLPATTEAEAVYPTLCTTLLPAGLLGLIIAAMLAATMSMLSGDYNVCANVLTNDVYKRLWRPQASQRELVAAGRLTTLLVGLLALGIAFLVLWRKEQGGGQDTLFRSMVQLFSVATAPVAVPMIAGLLSRRVTPTAALVGFIAGLSAGLALFFMFPGTMVVFGVVLQKENGILFSTMAVTLAFTVLVSWVDVLLPDERLRIQAFMERLATPIGRLPEDHKPPAPAGARRAFSPMAVSGFMVVLVGLLMLAILPAISESYARWLDLGVAIALVAVGAGMIILGRRRLPSD